MRIELSLFFQSSEPRPSNKTPAAALEPVTSDIRSFAHEGDRFSRSKKCFGAVASQSRAAGIQGELVVVWGSSTVPPAKETPLGRWLDLGSDYDCSQDE